jgi:Zn-dependent protease with chaperone function
VLFLWLGMLYAPLIVWVGIGVGLVYALRHSAPPVVLRLGAGFTALWALFATTVTVWVLSHGGGGAVVALLREPLSLFAPQDAGVWVAGAAGAVLVLATAFGLNQLVGRSFLRLWRPTPMRWPIGIPRPAGHVSLLQFEGTRPDAFSFALLRLRRDGRWRLHRQEIILMSQGIRDTLTSTEQAAVVAHELGHLKDLDARYLTFLRTLARLMRWDPVLGYVAWRLSLREEYAADDEAVRLTGRPLALARALYKVLLSSGNGRPSLAAGFLSSSGPWGQREAIRRIHRLLELEASAPGALGE